LDGWRAAFPALELTVEKEIAEDDFVTVLWRGVDTNTGSWNGPNATGKKADGRGIGIFRVVDGKIKVDWTETRQLLILRTTVGEFDPECALSCGSPWLDLLPGSCYPPTSAGPALAPLPHAA
jgi:hypothetical protein